MLTLYHLASSHFSEKARWALDYKSLPYRSRLLMPGFHMITARRIAGTRTVPFLTDSETGAVVADSTDILHYLDRVQPEPALFPRDVERGNRAAELEEYFDEHCARHVSGASYHYVLAAPAVLAAAWTRGLPGPQRALVRGVLPLFRRAMRRQRGISAERARADADQVLEVLDRLAEWLAESGGGYLVGDAFSAADLAASALLGPVVLPPESPWGALGSRVGAPSEGFPPPEYAEFLERVSQHEASGWVRRIWETHRRPGA